MALFTEFLRDLIFPRKCVTCSALVSRGEAVCAPCFARIPIHRTLFCGECRSRLPSGKKLCHKNFPYLLGAATDYEASARDLIRALKFRFMRDARAPLAALLIRYAESIPEKFSRGSVVPIPLARARLRKRGFNQSELIGAAFAARFNLPFENSTLVRTRYERPQREITDFAEKRRNVAGCFAVVSPEAVRGKTIVLIDDVATSGATLKEATEALTGAGARNVIALVVAKA